MSSPYPTLSTRPTSRYCVISAMMSTIQKAENTLVSSPTRDQRSLRKERLQDWLRDDGLAVQGRLFVGSSRAQQRTATSAKPTRMGRNWDGRNDW
ncbi:hypothetical protein BGZ61DRAFT_467218 [Ilyonectria robusta]|uniref:uncharacterized protein n=1 Tax=Ilyonectria robusta TaxID=1079257 RepID=UPI001E8D6F8C|nr:uncharacterized protein BGZ61DRAFT_467218 [Ilyonectria robusta]KAH8654855.1 hypothetical protein BGZ61DRAFT_467218 [Ilyonectria robusta]